MIRAFKIGAGWAFRRGPIVLMPYITNTASQRLMWRVYYRSGHSLAFARLETAWGSFLAAREQYNG